MSVLFHVEYIHIRRDIYSCCSIRGDKIEFPSHLVETYLLIEYSHLYGVSQDRLYG